MKQPFDNNKTGVGLSSISILVLLSIWLFLFLSSPSRAQWIPSQGIDGAAMYTLDICDTVLFISARGQGVSKRNINTGAWQKVFGFEQSMDLLHIGSYEFCNPQGSVYRSQDFGQTWIEPSLNFQNANCLKHLDTVLFCCCSDRVFRSYNYGSTWENISGTMVSGWKTIWANDGIVYCFSNGAVSNQKLYFTLNMGTSWDSIPSSGLMTGEYGNIYSVFHFQGNHFLSLDQGVFRFDQSSSHWISISDSLHFRDFIVFGNKLYGGGSGVYWYNQSSGTLVPMNNGLQGNEIERFSCNDSILYCAASNGIFKTDAGFNWENYSEGIHGGCINYIACNGDEIWVLADIGYYKSTDNGITFQHVAMPAGARKMIISGTEYYLMTSSSIYVSYDQGASWLPITNGLPANPWILDFSLCSQSMNLVNEVWPDSTKIFTSSKNQPLWNPVLSVFRDSWEVASIDTITVFSWQTDHNVPYPVRVTHDNFQTVDTVKEIPNGVNFSLHSDFGHIYILGYHDFYRSKEDYNSWDYISFLPSVMATDVSENNNGLVICGLIGYWSPYVYITYDLGVNWIDITENLFQCGSYSSKCTQVNGNRLFCGMDANGLWYRDDVLTSASEKQPENHILDIYPNPASDKAILEFKSFKASEGSYFLTDAQGRKVFDSGTRLFSQGLNREVLNTGKLFHGLYLVTVICNHEVYTVKLMVSKY